MKRFQATAVLSSVMDNRMRCSPFRTAIRFFVRVSPARSSTSVSRPPLLRVLALVTGPLASAEKKRQQHGNGVLLRLMFCRFLFDKHMLRISFCVSDNENGLTMTYIPYRETPKTLRSTHRADHQFSAPIDLTLARAIRWFGIPVVTY